MTITSITVETAAEHLGGEATREDLGRYLDHLENALAGEYPGAAITVREGGNGTRVAADSDDERETVSAFIAAHFERGEWAQ